MTGADDSAAKVLPAPGDGGAVTVEYALLLAAFGLPMVFAFNWLLSMLAEYYKLVTFLLSLPFP